MAETEVARLRRLRSSALRVRAIARALADTPGASNDSLLARAAGSNWRIARTVSGHLKAHPYAHYHREVGVGCRVCNQVWARIAALMARDRTQALVECESQLRRIMRQLDDARALTWSPDLSAAFGRSQNEVRSLITALGHETQSPRVSGRSPARAAPVNTADLSPPIGDWPYLAF